MSSKLDVNALMERNKSDLKAAEETMPMVAVDNRNWTAVISLLKRSCEVQEELLKLQGELMTKHGIEKHLQNQKVLFDQVENECRRIQQTTAEQTTNSLTSLISQSEKLSLQAGKLNEEFSSQRKELEEWKHRTQLKMLRAIVISQSVLLMLSLALQMWLR